MQAQKVFLMLIAVIILLTQAQANVDISVQLEPNKVSYYEPYTERIVIDPNGSEVSAVQMTMLWNASEITLNSIREGEFLHQTGADTFYSNGTVLIQDEHNRSRDVFSVILGNGSVTTNGTFLLINSTIKKQLSSNPQITNIMVLDANGNPLPANLRIFQLTIYPRWDLNKDGVVDVRDLWLVARHFLETTYEPYPAWDVNMDGIVNVQDLREVGMNFGKKV